VSGNDDHEDVVTVGCPGAERGCNTGAKQHFRSPESLLVRQALRSPDCQQLRPQRCCYSSDSDTSKSPFDIASLKSIDARLLPSENDK
jgi:hypothetical protein